MIAQGETLGAGWGGESPRYRRARACNTIQSCGTGVAS